MEENEKKVDTKRSKDKKVSSKKTNIVINPEDPGPQHKGEVVEQDSAAVAFNSNNELSERTTLNIAQRKRRAMIMRRLAPKLKRARMLAKKRFASQKNLISRSNKAARSTIRTQMFGKRGKDYAHLNSNQKYLIDKSIEKRATPENLKRIARRLLPKIRYLETTRLQKYIKNQQKTNESVSKYIDETISEKSLISLKKKSILNGIDFEVLKEVYVRGLTESQNEKSRETNAFDRVNSFISGGAARTIDEDLLKEEFSLNKLKTQLGVKK